MTKEKFQQRFNELEAQFRSIPIPSLPSGGGCGHPVQSGIWERWATSSQSLIRAVFKENAPHYINFTEALEKCRGLNEQVNKLGGIFLSAKDDFEGGYVFNVEMTVSGEIFGNFTVLAKEALKEGKKDVAAVLACAALEDALKRYAIANELDVDNKTMDEVVNALKSKGLVFGPQKSMLEAMPKIRNAAMHADWDKISEPDVSGVIGFTEQFLLSNFN